MRTAPLFNSRAPANEPAALHPALVNPGRLLQEMAASFRPVAAHKGLELEVAPCRDWHDVVTDVSLVRRILGDLLSHVTQHSSTGPVRLSVTPPDGEHWSITVEGVGHGTASKEIPLASGADGQRAPAATRSSGADLDLGLCKQLVERLGGKIFQCGAPGQEMCCKIRLPVMVRHLR